MRTRIAAGLITGGVLAAMVPGAMPVQAQDGAWTVVAEGLDAPRGLTFAQDGTLYVALAGSGGGECMDAQGPEGETMQMCPGATGSISTVDVATGTVTPVVESLPSVFLPVEGVLGPPDVAIDTDSTIFYLTPDGNVPDAPERAADDTGGIVWKVRPDGKREQVADTVAFEAANNPDGGVLDSNPNGLAIAPDGSLLVADAGGNALLRIDTDGSITVDAVFPDTMMEAPGASDAAQADPSAEPQMIPVQAVPTSVTVGPDEAAYVTFLTGGPFVPGAAWVARVAQGEEPTVYADGFTNVIDAAFASDGTLYVLEMATNGLASGDTTGGLWSVPAGGGEPTLVTTDGLVLPGGIAIGTDDAIYVSNGGRFPGEGSIVKLNA